MTNDAGKDRDSGRTSGASGSSDRAAPRPLGGIVHTYQRYDPKDFPSPTAPPPDLASMGMEHMMRHGSMRRFTPEELANAVKLDISQIAGMGPSLESLIAMLEERKRKILETYEVKSALRESERRVRAAAKEITPPKAMREAFERAVKEEQIAELEDLWYSSGGEKSPIGDALLGVMHRIGEKYQIEELDSKYAFTGNEATDTRKALELKEELEAIDKLLEQLREALKNAKPAIIDMEELSRFAQEQDVQQMRDFAKQIEEYLNQIAEDQGLEKDADGYRLTPKAYRVFQGKLLQEIFSSLDAARSGRHEGPVSSDGAVELASTKPFEFGDSLANLDAPQSFVNALLRERGVEHGRDIGSASPNSGDGVNAFSDSSSGGAGEAAAPRVKMRMLPVDMEIHRTRNNPKCATAVLLDMSGSMRNDGQYLNCKRMALALDGLIRREYPGDFLSFIEMYTLAKIRRSSEIIELMPKPVTIRNSVVRLKADMSDPKISESQLPPHFTNIQHALRLARQMLSGQDTPNKQVILLTDGLPTAHFEGSELFMLYPPDPRTEQATLREALACKRDGITINIFLLPNWAQTSEDVAFARTIAEQTGGRVFFTAGNDVDRYVLWDYVSHRRKIIG
ncbi:MAG: VWA domain-containing protein [Phycisphaerales bacterium]|nr:VWA domain-containing protein [Phycisphaerales bacterium]